MLDTIREIGIFMIAAQAVVHFAPGRQYEKYIKSVSGIIILLLFLKPVFQLAGTAWEEPRILLEKWEAFSDMPAFSGKMQTNGVTEEVVKRMETEMKERLNSELGTDAYFVSRVSIRFTQEQDADTGALLPEVEIWMKEGAGGEEAGQIEIEEIVVGQTWEPVQDAHLSSYRMRFAALLGMEEERVEVRRDGRG
ncbi:MAG: stage III sporulation protein AF [Lachnospiraceae bacterium]|nr:stage III sporulation protein AF [Lachnospiraceae bacterium]